MTLIRSKIVENLFPFQSDHPNEKKKKSNKKIIPRSRRFNKPSLMFNQISATLGQGKGWYDSKNPVKKKRGNPKRKKKIEEKQGQRLFTTFNRLIVVIFSHTFEVMKPANKAIAAYDTVRERATFKKVKVMFKDKANNLLKKKKLLRVYKSVKNI